MRSAQFALQIDCVNNGVVKMCWLDAILLVLLLVVGQQQLDALICSRYPTNTVMPKSPVDENFVVSISGNPQTYVLGQEYNVSIQAFNGLRYISFKLALEHENGDPSINQDLGHFELLDPVETRYSPNCINMVESTNTNPKTRIDVLWIAPQAPGNGCVLIRATLLQHRDVWFMDDGGLTRRICEEIADEVESAPKNANGNSCCVCDEARYELTFEGSWSRNLHPKDFPAKGWITRFSDIVGAAHASDYRFWEYAQLATKGMQDLAEHGATMTLEREFNHNFKNGKIRTIIKARGPAFPSLNGQSLASIRVDPQHHLLSLASKIDPSPDWIVGVSGLELCMPNCTWLDQKTITLYPWDIGTDAGPSYTSPDQPQVPADVIRRMRSDFPNDPRSPFFDQTGAPMKPLALLKIKRQRLYERLCEDEESNNGDVPRECFTHPWTAWSSCTAKCGEGRQFRTRVYKQPDVASIYNCRVETRQDRACTGAECPREERRHDRMRDHHRSVEVNLLETEARGNPDDTTIREECQLNEWGPWSPCSRTCGEGTMMRRRQYVNLKLEERCQGVKYERLVEYQKCMGRSCLEDSQSEHVNQVAPTEADNERHDGGKVTYNSKEEQKVSERGDEATKRVDFHEDRVAEEEHKQENVERPAFNNWQRTRGGSEYSNRRPINSQEADNRQYDNEWGGLEQEPREVDEKYTNEEDNYSKSSPNRYGYSDRYNGIHRESEGYGASDEDENDLRTRTRDRNRHPNSRTYSEERADNEVTDLPPTYCFEPLKRFTCLKAKVFRNFWFYNYCEDQCMLFTTDGCDENANKFTSLERCEATCRPLGNEQLLQSKQERHCFRPFERNKSRRRHPRF